MPRKRVSRQQEAAAGNLPPQPPSVPTQQQQKASRASAFRQRELAAGNLPPSPPPVPAQQKKKTLRARASRQRELAAVPPPLPPVPAQQQQKAPRKWKTATDNLTPLPPSLPVQHQKAPHARASRRRKLTTPNVTDSDDSERYVSLVRNRQNVVRSNISDVGRSEVHRAISFDSNDESEEEYFIPATKRARLSQPMIQTSSPRSYYVPNLSNIDPLELLANVFEQSLHNVIEATSTNNPCLVNRLSSGKDLQEFSGNPLEWYRFKQNYEVLSELGKYSKKENVLRLVRSLKGEARSAIENLLATNVDDPNLIIETLELLFENRNIILEKIVTGLKGLSEVISSMDILEFSTKLSSAVNALNSLGGQGYLGSPELLKEMKKSYLQIWF